MFKVSFLFFVKFSIIHCSVALEGFFKYSLKVLLFQFEEGKQLQELAGKNSKFDQKFILKKELKDKKTETIYEDSSKHCLYFFLMILSLA